ncbi:uncharacterized protein CMC5_049580 [Chondromyces crocatus]|uniref:Uncharacterized protein n=1 Tax=Chondromyces crocatus TaxID=52 RepID=A0A0K1EJF1_CHOCO|nr:uncharacterized protein CMC5_049580 [Chondromyces crocatus]
MNAATIDFFKANRGANSARECKLTTAVLPPVECVTVAPGLGLP